MEVKKIKEFKSPLKIPGGGEGMRCYYPFKLDTYGCGCSNNCAYCYAKSVLWFRKLWDETNPAVASYDAVKKMLDKGLDDTKQTKFSKLLQDRVPLRLGGMTDCFSDVEKTHRTTLNILKLLKEYDYPYLILTKNKLIAEDEYIEALDKELAYIQFTMTTPYDDISALFEEGASLTSERLTAARTLSSYGFHLAARINPFFPMHPDGYYSGYREVPREDLRPFRYFDWDLIKMLADAGFKTVIGGFLRLSTWNIKWIKEKTGEDLTWLFDAETKQKNSALHFSTEEKRYYYEKAQTLSHENGMEFSVCYDGDDAYEEFRYLWANENDCCNGKDKIRGFKVAFDFENNDFLNVKNRA